MIFRQRVTIIILLCACAYGAWRVLSSPIPSYQQDWLAFILLMCAPWILCIGSIKAWHRCYTWRLMLDHRNIEPVLSRGGILQQKYKSRPHILEHVCVMFFILSIAAILKLFNIENIGWIISFSIISIILLRGAIRRSR